MPEMDLRSVRMVIQHIGVEPAYRLVVYSDLEKPRHADFSSKQTLLRALHAAFPDFDSSAFVFDPLHGRKGSIVFAGEVELDDRQLGRLLLV